MTLVCQSTLLPSVRDCFKNEIFHLKKKKKNSIVLTWLIVVILSLWVLELSSGEHPLLRAGQAVIWSHNADLSEGIVHN